MIPKARKNARRFKNVCRSVFQADVTVYKLTVVRLKKSTAQWFRVDNLARIFITLSWYDYTSLSNV